MGVPVILCLCVSVLLNFGWRWNFGQEGLTYASLWHMHESHNKPREGRLELNDAFAIINIVPTIACLPHGFFKKGFILGLCFGASSVSATQPRFSRSA